MPEIPEYDGNQVLTAPDLNEIAARGTRAGKIYPSAPMSGLDMGSAGKVFQVDVSGTGTDIVTGGFPTVADPPEFTDATFNWTPPEEDANVQRISSTKSITLTLANYPTTDGFFLVLFNKGDFPITLQGIVFPNGFQSFILDPFQSVWWEYYTEFGWRQTASSTLMDSTGGLSGLISGIAQTIFGPKTFRESIVIDKRDQTGAELTLLANQGILSLAQAVFQLKALDPDYGGFDTLTIGLYDAFQGGTLILSGGGTFTFRGLVNGPTVVSSPIVKIVTPGGTNTGQDGTDPNGSQFTSGWCTHIGSGNPRQLSPGTVVLFASQFIGIGPPHAVQCDGSTYATTGIMADLFAILGHTFGGSGGTFAVPTLAGPNANTKYWIYY